MGNTPSQQLGLLLFGVTSCGTDSITYDNDVTCEGRSPGLTDLGPFKSQFHTEERSAADRRGQR